MISHEQLLDFCDSYRNHPEQGIKACRKILQKQPNSLMHQLALPVFSSQLERNAEALQLCDQVGLKLPEWCEPELVVQFQDLLVSCHQATGTPTTPVATKLTTLWKDQFEKFGRLNGREVRTAMFKASFANGQWDLLQQLFAWLQKDFPKNPVFHLSWIAATQILSNSMSSRDAKMSIYFNLLAYKSCKLLISNTLEGKDTPRKVDSTQQLRLISYVLRQQGHTQELLELLDSSKIGISSDVGKHDVEFLRLKMDILLEKEQWQTLQDMCLQALQSLHDARSNPDTTEQQISMLSWADDWTVWRNLFTASSGMDSTAAASTLIDEYLQVDPISRTAARARLLHISLNDKSTLAKACVQFIKKQAYRRACFDDVRDYLIMLQPDEKKTAPQDIASSEDDGHSITARITALKIEYLLMDSSNTAEEGDTGLSTFVTKCLAVYEESTESSSGETDDACILAATALYRLHTIQVRQTPTGSESKSQRYLLQALCLLHNLSEKSPHNFNAKLFALRLQQRLGLYSTAVKTFTQGLNPKQVQWDSLGHLLFTRVSTIHPHRVNAVLSRGGSPRSQDPYAAIDYAMEWNDDATHSITTLLAKDLDKLAYDKLPEFDHFKASVVNSFSLAMMTLEKRRVARMQGKSLVGQDLPARLSAAEHDNRDFKSFLDFEPGPKTFEELTACGPRPGMYWLARWTLNDLVQMLMTSKTPEAYALRLEEIASRLSEASSDGLGAEFTDAEQTICVGWQFTASLACNLVLGKEAPLASTDVKKDFAALQVWVDGTLRKMLATDKDAEILTWEYLHARWLALEFIKALDKLCDLAATVAKQKGHVSAPQIQATVVSKIKSQGREIANGIQSDATFVAKLKKTGAVSYEALICDGEVGEQILRLSGKQKMSSLVKTMIDDAIDGLDGLAKVKLF